MVGQRGAKTMKIENFKRAKNLRFLSMNKKGFVSLHPGLFFIAGLIIGAVVTWYAITQGWVPVSLPAP